MERVGSVRAVVVRTVGTVAVVACLNLIVGVAQAAAQTPPPAQQPPAPAQPAQEADPLKFSTDSPVLLINSIKADKTADFESAWGAIRAAFAKTEKPELKSFGETLGKLYKIDTGAAAAPPAAGAPPAPSLYILQIDTPSKAHSYNPVKIVYETLLNEKAVTREEADAIYAKLKDSVQNINFWVLTKIG
jgi:hypothetical protein